MGCKAIKAHYNIGHIVQLSENNVILVGSGFIPDLISIDLGARKITPSKILHEGDGELQGYISDFTADLDKLLALAAQDDVFDVSLPVYSCKGGVIVEDFCEEYGWPNLTHGGELMYDNQFFKTRQEAVDSGLRNTEAAVKSHEQRVKRIEADLAEAKTWLAESVNERDQLEASLRN
jgi:hypothetical protein